MIKSMCRTNSAMEIIGGAWVLYFSSFILSCRSANVRNYRTVVYPELFEGREGDGTSVLKIREDLILNLEKSSVLQPGFFLRTYRQGVPQHTYYDVDALQEDLYHDKRHLAAVILSENEGALQVEGVVSPNLKIKPMAGDERSEDGRHPHLLEAIEDKDADNVYGKMPGPESSLLSPRNTGLDPDKYNVEKVYPEILLVVDSHFRAGFNTTRHMMKYLLTEFEVVQLRYLTVSRPKVQIEFRGVEITTVEQEAYYYQYLTHDEIDSVKTLEEIVKYVEKHSDMYGIYDMVYFLTGMDIVAVSGSQRESSLSGLAYVASACTKNREQLGEDTAYTYKGIRIFAHEVAHTLGCPHDGTYIDGYVKGFKPDSSNCPWTDGYIMSYTEEDSRSMKFSSCCDYQISLMTWSFEAACLHRKDSNTTDILLKKYMKQVRLPGEFLTLNKQCRLTFPTLKKTYYMPTFGVANCRAECFVPGEQFNAADNHWTMLLIDGTVCDSKNGRFTEDGSKMNVARLVAYYAKNCLLGNGAIYICINGDCVKWKNRSER